MKEQLLGNSISFYFYSCCSIILYGIVLTLKLATLMTMTTHPLVFPTHTVCSNTQGGDHNDHDHPPPSIPHPHYVLTVKVATLMIMTTHPLSFPTHTVCTNNQGGDRNDHDHPCTPYHSPPTLYVLTIKVATPMTMTTHVPPIIPHPHCMY